MTWLTASDYKLPDKNASAADFILAYDVRSDLMNAITNFIDEISPQYKNPETYIEAMIVWAQSIAHYSPRFCPPGWNPIQAAILVSFSCFDMLRNMNAKPLDSTNTQSIYDVWTKTPTAVPSTDTRHNDTGPGSVQSGTIFGGTK